MSTTNRRTFTKQFKQDVVQQSQHCETITELAADLGLRPELIYRWRSELRDDPQGSFPGRGIPKQTPEEEQIAQLKAKVADLRNQRNILKKAMGIFADQNT